MIHGIAAGFFLLDRLTKILASIFLEEGKTIVLLPQGILGLELYRNEDIVFHLSFLLPILPFFVIAVSIGVGKILITAYREGDRWKILGGLLLLEGTVSNVVDRLWIGAVVDFLKIGHQGMMNVADFLIIAGASILLFKKRLTGF